MTPTHSSYNSARMLLTLLLALNVITFQPSTVSAHSWLDCTDMRDYGCAGFPLGYPSRGDIDINTKYTYLVQDRRPDASVCQPGRQNIPGNNPFPIASVTPGQGLHLTWQPDGHLNDANPSIIEIHWSGVPDTQLHTRSELSSSTVLGTMIFATSANCDSPSEPNTCCHGHLTIPESTKPGTYQLVWWWKYDRNPHGEEYSTCFEINVSGGSAKETAATNSPPLQQVEATTVPLAPTIAEANLQVGTTPDTAIVKQMPERLELAYLTEESGNTAPTVAAMSSVPTVKNVVDSVQDDPPTDVTSQPSKSLADVYNIGNDQIVGEGVDIGYNGGDEMGDLAGDAVNNEEDKDLAPQPVPSPSQLINCTVDAVLAPSNASALTTNTNESNTETRNNTSDSNATILVPTLRPNDANSPNTPYNRTLASLYPLDSGSSAGEPHRLIGCLTTTVVMTIFAF
ncbi:hypothetical protein EMPS_11058 [Entomortierella parvispora]|uniref:Chitin-binding type-4 domain-containing protein n=1 Tax=Entomortierella parvispora TaxID=205924 RepID=A0A9P3M1S2_9FUNG|nr:hypothetical protein EMPS_11058 [Entomortierella parvispora]